MVLFGKPHLNNIKLEKYPFLGTTSEINNYNTRYIIESRRCSKTLSLILRTRASYKIQLNPMNPIQDQNVNIEDFTVPHLVPEMLREELEQIWVNRSLFLDHYIIITFTQ